MFRFREYLFITVIFWLSVISSAVAQSQNHSQLDIEIASNILKKLPNAQLGAAFSKDILSLSSSQLGSEAARKTPQRLKTQTERDIIVLHHEQQALLLAHTFGQNKRIQLGAETTAVSLVFFHPTLLGLTAEQQKSLAPLIQKQPHFSQLAQRLTAILQTDTQSPLDYFVHPFLRLDVEQVIEQLIQTNDFAQIAQLVHTSQYSTNRTLEADEVEREGFKVSCLNKNDTPLKNCDGAKKLLITNPKAVYYSAYTEKGTHQLLDAKEGLVNVSLGLFPPKVDVKSSKATEVLNYDAFTSNQDTYRLELTREWDWNPGTPQGTATWMNTLKGISLMVEVAGFSPDNSKLKQWINKNKDLLRSLESTRIKAREGITFLKASAAFVQLAYESLPTDNQYKQLMGELYLSLRTASEIAEKATVLLDLEPLTENEINGKINNILSTFFSEYGNLNDFTNLLKSGDATSIAGVYLKLSQEIVGIEAKKALSEFINSPDIIFDYDFALTKIGGLYEQLGSNGALDSLLSTLLNDVVDDTVKAITNIVAENLFGLPYKVAITGNKIVPYTWDMFMAPDTLSFPVYKNQLKTLAEPHLRFFYVFDKDKNLIYRYNEADIRSPDFVRLEPNECVSVSYQIKMPDNFERGREASAGFFSWLTGKDIVSHFNASFEAQYEVEPRSNNYTSQSLLARELRMELGVLWNTWYLDWFIDGTSDSKELGSDPDSWTGEDYYFVLDSIFEENVEFCFDDRSSIPDRLFLQYSNFEAETTGQFLINVRKPNLAPEIRNVTATVSETNPLWYLFDDIQVKDDYTRTEDLTFEVDYGDGRSDLLTGADLFSFSHEYLRSGTYTVKITAIDEEGARSKPWEIKINSPVALKINVTGENPPIQQFKIHEKLTFDASNSFVPVESGSLTWSWDFGDGQTATGLQAEHTYTQPDEYNVTLSVVYSGETYTTEYTAYISLDPSKAPTKPVISSSQTHYKSGDSITLNASSTSTAAPTISYAWYTSLDAINTDTPFATGTSTTVTPNGTAASSYFAVASNRYGHSPSGAVTLFNSGGLEGGDPVAGPVLSRYTNSFNVEQTFPIPPDDSTVSYNQALIVARQGSAPTWIPTKNETYSDGWVNGGSERLDVTSYSGSISTSDLTSGYRWYFQLWYRYWDSCDHQVYRDDELVCVGAYGYVRGDNGHAVTALGSDPSTFPAFKLADSPYIMSSSVTVESGTTLTVPAGIILKFNGGGITVKDNATLNLTGSVLTSIHDDEHGGDTNGNGDKTKPDPEGSWGSITFEKGATGIIESSTLRYGGGRYSSNIVNIYEGSDVTIQNSVIRDGGFASGIHVSSSHATLDNNQILNMHGTGIRAYSMPSGKIINNIVTGSGGWGIDIYANDEDSTLTLTDNQVSDNQQGGLQLYGKLDVLKSYTGIDSLFLDGTSSGNMELDAGRTWELGAIKLMGQANWQVTTTTPIPVGSLALSNQAKWSTKAGSTLKFNGGGITVKDNATLNLTGSVLTSIHDDEHGGDTNGNGDKTKPDPEGSWGSITFEKGATGVIESSTLRYGGRYGSSSIISIWEGSNVSILNSVIQDGGYSSGIHVSSSHATLDNNQILNMHGTGIRAYSMPSGKIINNIVTGSGGEGIYLSSSNNSTLIVLNNQSYGNSKHGINISGNLNVLYQNAGTDSIHFSGKSSHNFALTENTKWTMDNLTLNKGAHWIIGKGQLLKLDNYANIQVKNGAKLDINQAVLTSIHDDEHGGDTNGNGDKTKPNPEGSWGSITFEKGATGVIESSTLRYGGRYGSSSIISIWEGSNVSILNSVIQDGGYSSGIHVSSSHATLDNNQILNMHGTEIYVSGTDLDLRNHTFSGNGNYAVYNASSSRHTVDARYSDWSHKSGPYHEKKNPKGKGDKVSDGVRFAPWGEEPDSDSDGILDSQDNCPDIANTDQANFDGDHLGDVCDPDDDNDGMSDLWETLNGLDPYNPNDAKLDSDGDGLTNLEEFNAKTDPYNKDSDGDGMNDKDEIDAGRDPNDPSDSGNQIEQALPIIIDMILQ